MFASAGICGVVRTTGLNALSKTEDYLCKLFLWYENLKSCANLTWLIDETSPSVMWTSSEITLTMICVSVPVLRPLWKRVSIHGLSSSDGYKQYQDDTGKGSDNIRLENLPTIDGALKHGAERTLSSGKGEDYGSDASILEHGNDRMGGIRRKHDIELVFQDEISAGQDSQV